jgi:two-component system, NarL family, sensor kinase
MFKFFSIQLLPTIHKKVHFLLLFLGDFLTRLKNNGPLPPTFVGMKCFTLVFLVWLMLPLSVRAQSLAEEEKALLEKEKNLTTDEERFQLLRDLGYVYEFTDSAKAFHYYRKALQFAESAKNNVWLSAAYLDHGSVHFNSRSYNDAIDYYRTSLLYAKLAKNERRQAAAYTNLANAFYVTYSLDSALHYGLRAYDSFTKLEDNPQRLKCISNLTAYYEDEDMYTECLEWIEKGMLIAEKEKDPISKSRLAIAGSQTARAKGDSALFFSYLNMAIKEVIFIEEDYFKVSTYQNISGMLNDEGFHVLANQYADSALRYISTDETGIFNASVYLTKGRALLGLQQNSSAESYLLRAKELALPAKDYFMLREIFLSLSDCSAMNKNYRLAFDYHVIYSLYDDSVNVKLQSEKFAEVDARYQKKQKQAEIENLKQATQLLEEKNRNRTYALVILGLLIGLLVLVGIVVYRNNTKRVVLAKKQLELNEARIKELEQAAQLAALESIIQGEELERKRVAQDLHDGVGSLLSGVKLSLSAMKGNVVISEELAQTFERSIAQLDNAIAEMRRVAYNMMPEALARLGLVEAVKLYCTDIAKSTGFSIHFEYKNLGTTIPSSQEIVVFRIIQELVNNAVKHSSGSSIIVQLSSTTEGFILEVEDNGKGMKETTSNGIGLQNLKNRVHYLKGKLDIRSEEGKGVSVLIEFPEQ